MAARTAYAPVDQFRKGVPHYGTLEMCSPYETPAITEAV